MQMISMLFLKIVNMSLTAGVVILVVLFVRLLIKKLPKSFAYMLWTVVAFRLIVPVSADADISIFNLFDRGNVSDENSWMNEVDKNETIRMKQAADQKEDLTVNNSSQTMQEYDHFVLSSHFEDLSDTSYIPGRSSIWMKIKNMNAINIMALVWIVGILTLVSYTVAAHIRIKRRIRYSILLCNNVYECDNIRSPFVYGIISPRIYLPFRLSRTEQQCILAHERYHIQRRDYLIKSIAYMLVIVYWFQPFVWIAYRLMCADMEMSCDEKVISEITVDMRKEYSRSLLAFATNQRQRPVSPIAFGEENTMKRIKNILNYKKPARWKLAGGAVLITFTMAACATDASVDGAIAPIPDQTLEMENDYHTNRHHQEEGQHHSIEHHQAQWAENTKLDLELCSLDYADSDKIVFHISSGLFEYDLQEQRITRSIDLKALNCQEVQTGGECRVTVYQNNDGQLKAAVIPYPYADGDGYIYDFERDELFAYDDSLLDAYSLFDGLISKYDLPEDERLKGWRHAENILPLGDHSYGILRYSTIDLVEMYYEAGDQRWNLFHKEQATLPKLLKQDDSFYQSFAIWSGKDVHQCLLDYSAFYNGHEYAGVCALSTGLTYSDKMQQEFSEHSDILWGAQEVSHSEDEKEYLFEFTCADDYGADGQKVYVNFKYIEGQGWRAEGLPSAQRDN